MPISIPKRTTVLLPFKIEKRLALYGFQTGRIFYANSPSQQARGASYNLLLLRKDCLFCHRSEYYGPPSPSISLESIKSQEIYMRSRCEDDDK